MLKLFSRSKLFVIFTVLLTTTNNTKMENTALAFEFRGLIFNGLKFRKSKRYSEKFYQELADEGSHLSEVKYIDSVNDEQDEEIHTKLSLGLVFMVASYVALFFTAFCLLNKLTLTGLVLVGIGAGFHALYKHFRVRANELFAGKEMGRELVKVLFNK